jgi:zinc transporter ZupT
VITYRKPNAATKKHDLARPALPPSTTVTQDMTDVSWRRILLLIVAVTVHNIPEGNSIFGREEAYLFWFSGLAVGVGFGSIGASEAATFESASNLAFGIALQNFPEGSYF